MRCKWRWRTTRKKLCVDSTIKCRRNDKQTKINARIASKNKQNWWLLLTECVVSNCFSFILLGWILYVYFVCNPFGKLFFLLFYLFVCLFTRLFDNTLYCTFITVFTISLKLNRAFLIRIAHFHSSFSFMHFQSIFPFKFNFTFDLSFIS